MPEAWLDLALSWAPGEDHIYFSLRGGEQRTHRQAFSDAAYALLRVDFLACVALPEDPQPFRVLGDRLYEAVPDEIHAALAREADAAVLRLTLTPALQNLPWECIPLQGGPVAGNATWGTALRAVRFTGSTPHPGSREDYYLFYDEELSDDPCPPGVPRNPPPQVRSLFAAGESLRAAMRSAGVLHLLAHGVKVEADGHTCVQLLRDIESGDAFIRAEDIRDGALFADLRAPVVLADCCHSAWMDPRGGPSLAGRAAANGRAKLFLGNLDEAKPGERGSRFFTAFIARLYTGDSIPDCLLAARREDAGGRTGIMRYIAVCHISREVAPTDTLYELLGVRRPARRGPALWRLPVCVIVGAAAATATARLALALTGRELAAPTALLLGAGLGLLFGIGLLAYDFFINKN